MRRPNYTVCDFSITGEGRPSGGGGEGEEGKREGPVPADLDGAERRGGVPRGSDCQLRGWEEGRSVHARVNAWTCAGAGGEVGFGSLNALCWQYF